VNIPTRNIQLPQRLNECVRFLDTEVSDDGELVQVAKFDE